MNETPTPSRRRGRPPKNQVITISTLAPPQESVDLHNQAVSVQPESPLPQAPTVPSPLPAVIDDGVDLRESPAMVARHVQFSGSDSTVHGASEALPPLEAGPDLQPNPALPEQSQALPGQPLSLPERIPDIHLPAEAPAAPVHLSWTPVQAGDVVQINSHRHKYLGTLFIVGDIKNNRVHGYQIGNGNKLEYFTVNEDECILVGAMTSGQIRARKSCSPKWHSENR